DWMESNLISLSNGLLDYNYDSKQLMDFGKSLKKQKKFKLSKVVRYITKSL
ncbi:13760_t:CDS:1, partial [Dentiscutata heterogama]